MTDSPLIEVETVSLGWGDELLLENVSFEVERGDIFVVLGGSGCGKSTLLRHLIGLESPHKGNIRIKGRNVTQRWEGPPMFGVMFQAGALFGSMTVGENVGFPLREWTTLPESAVDAIVRAKLALVGLDGSENRLPSELSGGMRKRAAIARSLALEPELLFLDEPSAGLDPVTSAALDELILVLNDTLGITVVMVTHELPSILRVGKTCIMLDKDERGIIARGNPRTLAANASDPRVAEFFARGKAH